MLTQFLFDDVSQCNVAEVLCKPGAAPAFPVSISLTTALGSRVKGKRNRLRFLGAYGHRLVLQPLRLVFGALRRPDWGSFGPVRGGFFLVEREQFAL